MCQLLIEYNLIWLINLLVLYSAKLLPKLRQALCMVRWILENFHTWLWCGWSSTWVLSVSDSTYRELTYKMRCYKFGGNPRFFFVCFFSLFPVRSVYFVSTDFQWNGPYFCVVRLVFMLIVLLDCDHAEATLWSNFRINFSRTNRTQYLCFKSGTYSIGLY